MTKVNHFPDGGQDSSFGQALALGRNTFFMFGNLNPGQIEALLGREIIGRIGCSNGNFTYVVPISYAYDGEHIYCHTREGMKINYMRRNPRVCFEVDHQQNMGNWQCVIAWGVFEELIHPEERKYALSKLHGRHLPFIPSETARLSSDWPFGPEEANDIPGVTFRIRLTKKTGRFEMTTPQVFFAS